MKHRFLQITLMGFTLIFLSFQVFGQDNVVRPAPEISTGLNITQQAIGTDFMIVTAHPEATKAGYAILEKGGTAADAAIAAQLVLGLVEPQSSGIGGGGFLLYFDKESGQLTSFDGRETAPALAGKHLFRGAEGKPMTFKEAALGGRAVGVPGMIRLLENLHGSYGKTAWADLFAPAIILSERGFTVTPRLEKLTRAARSNLRRDMMTKLHFFPDTIRPVKKDHTLHNYKYANTLRQIATSGADVFYSGPIAEAIVKKVREDDNPGLLSLEDLSRYQIKIRKPVCGSYRGYKICSMGEPSSGGLTILQILGMLERFDLRAMGPYDPASWHLITEASRLAFADRNYYMADPDFVETPGDNLIDPVYLRQRSHSIDYYTPIETIQPGVPVGTSPALRQPDASIKPPGTTHLSIIDRYGNILSMTSSIEQAFGSHVMVEGFLLNNQLTDFSFIANKDGKPVANAPAGGKKPRSSMAPVIVFDPAGKPFLVVGSAGGSRIIGYVLQRLIATIDWDKDIASALEMPHILSRGPKIEIEKSGDYYAKPLEYYGHSVAVGSMNSGLTAIQISGATYVGAADPRREGIAMGQ